MLSRFSRVLMDCRSPGSSVHRILQARILKWVVMSSSKGSSWLRDQIWVSCIAGGFFHHQANLCWIPKSHLFPWPCPWTLDSHLSKHSISLHHFHLKFHLNPNINCISNLPFSKVNSNLGPLVSKSPHINSWFFHLSDSSGQILESPRTLSFSSLWLPVFQQYFLSST